MQKFVLMFAAVAMSFSGCATGSAAQAHDATASQAPLSGPTDTPPASHLAAAAPATAAATAESCPLPAQGAKASAEAASAEALVTPGMAKVGDRTSCPVSHETFVVKADSPKAEYNGKTYYFCCDHCTAKFEANPAKFAQAE